MLTIYQLEVTLEVTTPLALDIYCGSALRGAFFHALWGRFCSNREATTCYECPLNAACPVSSLVAPLRDEAPRGRDVPRPYIITPLSTEKEVYEPGDRYVFGFTLIGNASKLYPYVVRALLEMERSTLGHPVKTAQGKRGRFLLREILAVHPFTQQRVCLWQPGAGQPEKLCLAVTSEDVAARAKHLSPDHQMLRFLSPMRLIANEQVLRQPDFTTLILRMAERLEQIEQEYGSIESITEASGREWYLSLKALAQKVSLEKDHTQWVTLYGYSTRQQQKIFLSGFTGQASFVGELAELQELLVWGELLRVGKNIVKGAGFYQIED